MTAHRILSPLVQVTQDQVATILESVRAFYDNQKHKNDIIILFQMQKN
jgi:hypothetical protein